MSDEIHNERTEARDREARLSRKIVALADQLLARNQVIDSLNDTVNKLETLLRTAEKKVSRLEAKHIETDREMVKRGKMQGMAKQSGSQVASVELPQSAHLTENGSVSCVADDGVPAVADESELTAKQGKTTNTKSPTVLQSHLGRQPPRAPLRIPDWDSSDEDEELWQMVTTTKATVRKQLCMLET